MSGSLAGRAGAGEPARARRERVPFLSSAEQVRRVCARGGDRRPGLEHNRLTKGGCASLPAATHAQSHRDRFGFRSLCFCEGGSADHWATVSVGCPARATGLGAAQATADAAAAAEAAEDEEDEEDEEEDEEEEDVPVALDARPGPLAAGGSAAVSAGREKVAYLTAWAA